PARRFSLEPFRDRSFIALTAATMGLHFTQAGLLQALLPVHAQTALGANEAQVGFLLTLAPTVAFLLAYPNGMLSDRWGRKISLVPGLVLLSVAAFMLDIGDIYTILIIAMLIQGSGEAMTFGTTQTYAMDLAPERGRGSYIGMWTMTQATGATLGPLVITGIYHFVSPTASFLALGALLAFAAVLMLGFGRETAGPRAKPRD
ncbi:MAG: MFS transporter, partial [Dehalococcoidia bacterium]